MQIWKRAIFMCALAGVVCTTGLFVPVLAVARTANSKIDAVHAYVARTREVSTADYRIEARPEQDNLHIYRVTLNSNIKLVAPGERVFDVIVSSSGKVTGEYAVLPVDLFRS